MRIRNGSGEQKVHPQKVEMTYPEISRHFLVTGNLARPVRCRNRDEVLTTLILFPWPITGTQIQCGCSTIFPTLSHEQGKESPHNHPDWLSKKLIPAHPLLRDNITWEEAIDIDILARRIIPLLKPTVKFLCKKDITQLRAAIPPYSINDFESGGWIRRCERAKIQAPTEHVH